MTPGKPVPFLILSCLFMCCQFPHILAQSTMGTIRGTVADESKAVLPGVTMTVTNINTGISRSIHSDESGRYTVLSLPAAPYTIKAELRGFTPTVRERVTLEVAQSLDIDFVLKIAGLAERVVVTADAPLLSKDGAALSGVMDTKRMLELPINGRDFTRFSLLVPGAIIAGNGTALGLVSFNGLHQIYSSYMIDGVDASAGFMSNLPNGFNRGARLLTGSLESMQEFRVQTANYQAEYGRAAGAVINIVSKSGGNELHGTLFEFLRNSVLDAKNFFAPPAERNPLFILNQFGGNLSGPIVKNRTFYFVNYEGSRQRIGVTGNGTVPSQRLRERVLATSPALAPLLATMPLGTSPTANLDVDNYTTSRTLSVREDTGSIKIDHRLSGRDSFFARYNINDTRVFGSDVRQFLATDQFLSIPWRTTNVALQEQHTFSATTINEFKLGLQSSAAWQIFTSPWPRTTITGLGIGLGSTNQRVIHGPTSYQAIDHFSWSRGPHAFKTGMEIRRLRINNRSADSASMRYLSREDFVHNRVFSATLTPGIPGRGLRQTQYGFYFQDDFKARRDLTLNLGIRYEQHTVLSEVRDRLQPFNPFTGELDPPAAPLYRPDRNNWAPRFGFAWSLGRSERTVLRGGFGLYHHPFPIFTLTLATNIYANNLPGATTLQRAQIPDLSFPLEPFIGSGATPLPNVNAVDPRRRDFYTEQWNLNLQHELGSNMVLQVAYVGNHGINLYRNRNINLFDPRLGRRPNPRFADITLHENTAQSLYHSMQASVRRRWSRGLAFDLAYTYGHAIDDVFEPLINSFSGVPGGSIPGPQDSNNLRAERGNSSKDVRHNLAFNALYDLPFGPGRSWLGDTSGAAGCLLGGWQLNGLGILRTGTPFTVELAGDSPSGNRNTINQRPDRVAGVSSRPANRSIHQWLNPAAFAEPRTGTFGNLGRNTEYGPSFLQIDLSLLKTTKLSETKSLQFRAEFFNILNHPNFTNPRAPLLVPESFGKVFTTFGSTIGFGTARQVQFGL